MYDFAPTRYYQGQSLNAETGVCEVIRNLTRLASLRLKELLETKHLYQKVSVDPTAFIDSTSPRMNMISGAKRTFDLWAKDALLSIPLRLGLKEQFGSNGTDPLATLVLYNVKLCCRTCGRREAFTPNLEASAEKTLAPALQLYLLTYVCQSCQQTPHAFLVRRAVWELQLHGRSPIEEVEVPRYIPKTEYPFYRDAIVAFNSGKVLAALFYLRSFLEQFGRRVTGKTGKATGDEVMTAYNETLPSGLRDTMPSLREWYEKLSAPIHAAKDDAEAFEAARGAIEKHFDIRRVHAIPEPKPPAPDRQPENVNPAPQ